MNETSTRGNIVFVVSAALSERDVKRFGIHWLVQQGFAVTILDTTPIMFPRKTERRLDDATFTTFAVRTIFTRAQWKEELSTLSTADVVFCMASDGHYQADTLAVLRLISQSKTPYVVFKNNVLPPPATTFQERRALRRLWAQFRRFNAKHSIVARLPRAVLGLRPADFAVYGGRRSVQPAPLVDSATRAILAHAFDYDIYLENRARRSERPIAVYVDQHMGFHSDASALGIRQLVEPAAFYPRLEALFSRVEAEFGVEVVIAAHPRMDRARYPAWCAHRKVFHDRTAELVAEAKLVILCHSTAINWAVLFEKPVLQYATQSIVTHPFLHGLIESISDEIGGTVVFVDSGEDGDITTAIGFDPGRYARYKAEFIKQPGTADRYSWDLIVQALVDCGTLKGPAASDGLPDAANPPPRCGDDRPTGSEPTSRPLQPAVAGRQPGVGRPHF